MTEIQEPEAQQPEIAVSENAQKYFDLCRMAALIYNHTPYVLAASARLDAVNFKASADRIETNSCLPIHGGTELTQS